MRIRFTALLLAGLCIATPALAQSTSSDPAPAATAIDPARLAEARTLIEVMMPAAMREQMISNMVASVNETMTQTLMADPEFKRQLSARPGARDAMLRFLERQRQNTMNDLRANLPGMLEAMAKAYARRFTVPQMREMAAFFATPTGQLYITQSSTILSDPDVSGWMRQLMRRSMDRMPGELAKFRSELEALN